MLLLGHTTSTPRANAGFRYFHPPGLLPRPQVVAALSSAPDTPIEVVVRADGSGTTSIWTSALVRSLDLAGLSNPFIAASPDPDSAWLNPDVSFTRRDGNPGVSAYTSSKPYAIGYTVLGYALEADMSLVHVRTAHSVVAPSISAVEYAVAERGLSFNVPGRLTADLTGATGTSAWPAAGYTYLVVRTRTDIFADCNLRRELVLFWEWFYTDPVPRNLARLNGFAPLPEMVREVVVDALIDDVQCSDGSQALVPLQEGAILAFTGPRMLGGIMTLYGEIYQTAGSLVTVSYEDASTALSAPDWLALAQDMAPRSALLATLSTEGATWWGDGTGLVAAPFVRLRTGLFVHACDDDVACVPQAPREVSRETVARIAAGDIAGPAVWEALGLSFGVAPRVLCPRVGTSDRAVLERAVAEAWPGASVGGCEEASQQEMDQALLAFPGTVAFHLHTATTLEEGEVAEVPIAGSMAWDQDVFIVAKRDQGTCDPDGRALAHFLGWIFGHPSVIGDGEVRARLCGLPA